MLLWPKLNTFSEWLSCSHLLLAVEFLSADCCQHKCFTLHFFFVKSKLKHRNKCFCYKTQVFELMQPLLPFFKKKGWTFPLLWVFVLIKAKQVWDLMNSQRKKNKFCADTKKVTLLSWLVEAKGKFTIIILNIFLNTRVSPLRCLCLFGLAVWLS